MGPVPVQPADHKSWGLGLRVEKSGPCEWRKCIRRRHLPVSFRLRVRAEWVQADGRCSTAGHGENDGEQTKVQKMYAELL